MAQDTFMTTRGRGSLSTQCTKEFTLGADGFLAAAWALCSLSLVGIGAAVAEEPLSLPGSFSANVALTSEYYFRGLSQTDDAPALQGGIDYEVSLAERTNLYAGAWGSNVDFNEAAGVDGATLEIDLYGGINGSFGGTAVTWDAGVIYYAYPGADSSLDYDYWELQGALGYEFEIVALTASVNYSPENFAKSGAAFYPKLAVSVPVPGIEGLALSGYVAKQYIDDNAVFGTDDYAEWNLAVAYNLFGFDLAVAYSDTDINPSSDGNSEAVIFTFGRSF